MGSMYMVCALYRLGSMQMIRDQFYCLGILSFIMLVLADYSEVVNITIRRLHDGINHWLAPRLIVPGHWSISFH